MMVNINNCSSSSIISSSSGSNSIWNIIETIFLGKLIQHVLYGRGQESAGASEELREKLSIINDYCTKRKMQ